jgi:hypothetical protein
MRRRDVRPEVWICLKLQRPFPCAPFGRGLTSERPALISPEPSGQREAGVPPLESRPDSSLIPILDSDQVDDAASRTSKGLEVANVRRGNGVAIVCYQYQCGINNVAFLCSSEKFP